MNIDFALVTGSATLIGVLISTLVTLYLGSRRQHTDDQAILAQNAIQYAGVKDAEVQRQNARLLQQEQRLGVLEADNIRKDRQIHLLEEQLDNEQRTKAQLSVKLAFLEQQINIVMAQYSVLLTTVQQILAQNQVAVPPETLRTLTTPLTQALAASQDLPGVTPPSPPATGHP